MRSKAEKPNTALSSGTLKPFFAKKGEETFSIQATVAQKPFFGAATLISNNAVKKTERSPLIQRQSQTEDIEQSVRDSVSDEASFLSSARGIESEFPSGLTNPRRGYMSFQGGERILRRLRELDRLIEVQHVIESFRQIARGTGGSSYLDMNLTLAIAFRESGHTVLSPGTRMLNTFSAGGLDRLYGERARLITGGFVPREIADRWTQGEREPTEGSTATRVRMSNPAMIPERDLIIAYSGVVSARRQKFEQEAGGRGLSTAGLNARARRVWTALFFGGQGGLDYSAYRRQFRLHGRERGWLGSHFGAQTILSYMAANRHTLNDILNIETLAPHLYTNERTISAFIVVAEAEVLDRVIPQFANVQGQDDWRTSAGSY